MALESIPVEIFFVIFEYLEADSILCVTAASRFLHSLLQLVPTWFLIAGKNMPLSGSVDMSISSLRDHISRCYTFHNAWAAASESISTRIAREIRVPEGICMIRILPGCKYVVVVDLTENARFYSVETGAQVGCTRFNLTAEPEVLYSLDFAAVSNTTVLWGLLTADDLQRRNDAKKLCVRATLIHYPKEGSLNPSLRFEQLFAHELRGSAEMLSLSGSYMAAYSYPQNDDSTPTLYIWNWEQARLIAAHIVPWVISHPDGGYAGHPALHVTPSSILMIGGQLGFHHVYAQFNSSSGWDFSRVQQTPSSEEDANLLRFSSQGRCSRLWWGPAGTGRPWHRLVVSPSKWDHEGSRPIRVLTFEVPDSPEDTTARKEYTDLGEHLLASGFESSPQLFHVSRYGTKAVWLSPHEEEMQIKSVSMPSFGQQMEGIEPSPIKQVLLDPRIRARDLRAFDTDETGPTFAFANEDSLWIVEVV